MAWRKRKQSQNLKKDPLYEFRGPLWMRYKYTRHAAIRLIEFWLQARDYALLLGLFILGRKTVRSQSIGLVEGGKFAIFATYPGRQIFPSHRRFIEKLRLRGYNIIIASNHWASAEAINGFYGDACSYIFRRPFGRDFGCYKDAMALVYRLEEQTGVPIQRVILFNDSVISFEQSEEELITHLDNPDIPFAGIGENFEFNYHVGSYMMAFSGEVARQRRVRKYWRRYRPISTRRHSIHAGEMGLSRAISRSGYSANVLINLGMMRCRLEQLSLASLGRICEHMPPAFFQSYGGLWPILDGVIEDAIGTMPLDEQDAPASGIYGISGLQPSLLSPASFQEFELRRIGYRERLMGLTEPLQKSLIETSAKKFLIEKLLNFMFRQSQIHAGTAIILFMGGYLMKKDIVFRQYVLPHALPSLLKESGSTHSEAQALEIYQEVSSKGHPYSLTRGKRILYALGFI